MSMTSNELVEFLDAKVKDTLNSSKEVPVNLLNNVKTKIIREGSRNSFEQELSYHLSLGYEIPSGESMKVDNNTYIILITKYPTEKTEKTKKYL